MNGFILIVILLILLYGYIQKVPLFDAFLAGAKDGMMAAVQILPSLIALLGMTALLRTSGVLSLFVRLLSPLFSFVGIMPELIPTVILRPLSGSGSIALLTDIFKTYGADSVIGKTASVLMASTETTFYVTSLYFSAGGIKKTGRIIAIALLADVFTAVVASFLCK